MHQTITTASMWQMCVYCITVVVQSVTASPLTTIICMCGRAGGRMQSEIVVSKSMKTTVRLQRLPIAVVLIFMIVLVVVTAVMAVGLTSMPIIPAVFASATYSDDVDDVVSANPGSRDTLYGAHNFRRPKHMITEYDEDVAARLATLVERRSTAADPDLIHLIVDMLDPPSSHAVKMSRQLFSTPQSREVDNILRQKVHSDFRLSRFKL